MLLKSSGEQQMVTGGCWENKTIKGLQGTRCQRCQRCQGIWVHYLSIRMRSTLTSPFEVKQMDVEERLVYLCCKKVPTTH